MSGVVYPAQGISTLLSRAWNLFRLNAKPALLIMLVPTVASALALLLLSIQASGTFLTPAPVQVLAISLTLLAAGIGIWLVSGVLWFFSVVVLARMFYSAVVSDRSLSIPECWGFVRARVWALLALGVSLLIALLVFGLTDLGLFILLFTVSMMGFGALSAMLAAQNPALLIVVFMGMLLWGFLVMGLIIGLLSLEGLGLLFPLVGMATAPADARMTSRIRQSLRLLARNLPRMVVFAVGFFLFSLAISMALHTPMYIWLWFERSHLDAPMPAALPLHVNVVLNLWSSIVNMVLMPFYMSAVTLFWYDCQVRHEGLDWRLRFESMIRRRGRDPRTYLSATP